MQTIQKINMPSFTTTIQLQRAAGKDYDVLNNEMEKALFRLKKAPDNNRKAVIKRVQYKSKKNSSMKEVADAVYRAVKKTGLDYSFTIRRQRD